MAKNNERKTPSPTSVVPVDTRRQEYLKAKQEIMTSMTTLSAMLSTSGNNFDQSITHTLMSILQKYSDMTHKSEPQQKKLTKALTKDIAAAEKKKMWTSLFNNCNEKGMQEARKDFLNEHVVRKK